MTGSWGFSTLSDFAVAEGVLANGAHSFKEHDLLGYASALAFQVLRYAPAESQPVAWAGLGSASSSSRGSSRRSRSACSGLIADYPSVFAGRATVIVLMTDLYISSLALFFGVQLDACLRSRSGRGRG